MSNFLFIDDSGSKNWDTPYTPDFVNNPPARTPQNRKFWQDNYFVLAGLHIDLAVIKTLNPIINAKKVEVFGTKYAEIHSANLRNPYKKKKEYIDKFKISEEQLREFIEEFWYGILTDYDLQFRAVIVDKRYYRHARHEKKSPLEIAVETLFDRTELHPEKRCTIIFDQMDSEIKSTTNEQGKILQISGRKVNIDQQKYHHASVEFEKSSQSNFLQLADTVAYNVLRQFIDYGDKWEAPDNNDLPKYAYFERIFDKFYHHPETQQVKGYGIVKLPDPDGKKWTIKKPPID